jgi:hypothetical protein
MFGDLPVWWEGAQTRKGHPPLGLLVLIWITVSGIVIRWPTWDRSGDLIATLHLTISLDTLATRICSVLICRGVPPWAPIFAELLT